MIFDARTRLVIMNSGIEVAQQQDWELGGQSGDALADEDGALFPGGAHFMVEMRVEQEELRAGATIA